MSVEEIKRLREKGGIVIRAYVRDGIIDFGVVTPDFFLPFELYVALSSFLHLARERAKVRHYIIYYIGLPMSLRCRVPLLHA